MQRRNGHAEKKKVTENDVPFLLDMGYGGSHWGAEGETLTCAVLALKPRRYPHRSCVLLGDGHVRDYNDHFVGCELQISRFGKKGR